MKKSHQDLLWLPVQAFLREGQFFFLRSSGNILICVIVTMWICGKLNKWHRIARKKNQTKTTETEKMCRLVHTSQQEARRGSQSLDHCFPLLQWNRRGLLKIQFMNNQPADNPHVSNTDVLLGSGWATNGYYLAWINVPSLPLQVYLSDLFCYYFGKIAKQSQNVHFSQVYLPCMLQTKKRYVGYMYESLDQKEPVFDAKGIETVRRDSCPAVSKVT